MGYMDDYTTRFFLYYSFKVILLYGYFRNETKRYACFRTAFYVAESVVGRVCIPLNILYKELEASFLMETFLRMFNFCSSVTDVLLKLRQNLV